MQLEIRNRNYIIDLENETVSLIDHKANLISIKDQSKLEELLNVGKRVQRLRNNWRKHKMMMEV